MFELAIYIKEDRAFPISTYIPDYGEDDNIDSLVMDICDYLEKIDIIELHLNGFSGMRWPVDVRTDLSTIIPQIPDAIRMIRSDNDCNIQFYEQGIERDLIFSNNNSDDILIKCLSLDGFPLTQKTEIINKHVLLNMLIKLIDMFIEISKSVCPIIASHQIFKEWESECMELKKS